MNLIILFLISNTIMTSFSIEDSFFDSFGEPEMESDTVRIGSQGQERGYMKNCNPNSTYSFSWVPKDIDPHGPLTFFINYTNPARFDTGEFTVDIKYSFIHVSKKTKITCQDDLRKKFPLQNCPIEKEKFMVSIFTEYKDVIRFKNVKCCKDQSKPSKLPDLQLFNNGTFKVKLTIENDNGESLLCGTLEATLL